MNINKKQTHYVKLQLCWEKEISTLYRIHYTAVHTRDDVYQFSIDSYQLGSIKHFRFWGDVAASSKHCSEQDQSIQIAVHYIRIGIERAIMGLHSYFLRSLTDFAEMHLGFCRLIRRLKI